jgi:anti-sigma factor ChrR (cupin superfamily)
MNEGTDDGLSELAFVAAHGAESADERFDAASHARSCVDCRAILEVMEHALASSIPAVPPSEASRSRLLTAAEGAHRHAPFVGRVATLFELDDEAASSLLTSVATSDRGWRRGPGDGTAMWPVRSPANARGTQTLLLRIDGGCAFPKHRHLGDETVLVLEGAFRSNGDARASAGDVMTVPPNSVHHLSVAPGAPCLCAVRVEHGIEVVAGDSAQPEGVQ